MRRLPRGFTIGFSLATLTFLTGCDPPCMEEGYVRAARGSAEYTVSGLGHHEVDAVGALPATVTMQRYRPFRAGFCTLSSNAFTLDVGPDCRLEAAVTSRVYDSGEDATDAFIQAEALVSPGRRCKLDLGSGRTVSGQIDSGTIYITPSAIELVFALNVDHFSPMTHPSGGFFRYRMDAAWLGPR
jgi:hypothetical protein